jgi:uncharacterized membrane protein
MITVASSSGSGLIVVALFVAWLATVTICAMKGKPWFAALGILWGTFALVGAIRLAKPNSWWDRHMYEDRKHELAVERFTYRAGRP